MEEERTRRRLTTILAADVFGYSRLMAADEEATLRTLKTSREIIDRLIARHDGRIFNAAGDSVVAEFASAVEAVRCAMTIQEELRVRNAEAPEDRRMLLRIGVNVGDVMVDGDNLFGDGVNVAARLEGIAEPGGICISGSTFEQVNSKLSIGFEDIGAQVVKNIPHPVPAFRLRPGPITVVSGSRGAAAPAGRRRMAALGAAGVAALAIIGGGAWLFHATDAATRAQRAFDGAWAVTLVCPTGPGGVAGFTLRFNGQVKDGDFRGQHRAEGQPGSLTLAGKIQPDGTASMTANGVTDDPKFSLGQVARGLPYSHRVTARFEGAKGSGNWVAARTCNFDFVKQ